MSKLPLNENLILNSNELINSSFENLAAAKDTSSVPKEWCVANSQAIQILASQNTSKIVPGSQPNEIQKSSWEARNQPKIVPNRPKILAGSLPEASGGPRAGPVAVFLIFDCFCDPKMNPKAPQNIPEVRQDGPQGLQNCIKHRLQKHIVKDAVFETIFSTIFNDFNAFLASFFDHVLPKFRKRRCCKNQRFASTGARF